MKGVSSETPFIKEEYDQRRKTMKFRTVVILALALVLLLAVAVPASAARPTTKVKFSHSSDCAVTASGTLFEDYGWVNFGDTSDNTSMRALFKFPLGGVKVSSIEWVELKFRIVATTVNGTGYTPAEAPYPNIGLGDTVVVPIGDYGRTPSAASYNSSAIGNEIVLIPAGASANVTVSANVTDAVINAITDRSRFVTFRLQTVNLTDFDSENDYWKFAAHSRTMAKSYWPRLIVHLKQ
jgi:hypothetical protein